MVGDDDREPPILGEPDGRPLGDPRVAAEQHVDRRAGGVRVVQLFAQLVDLDAVAFHKAVGHVKCHGLVTRQRPQRRHQQRGRGLPVHVKVAPHQKACLGRDRRVQLLGRLRYAQQRGGRRRHILARVEKGHGLGRRIDPALRQQPGNQWIPAGDLQQFG